MTISSHQIHSVLRIYGQQFKRGMGLAKMREADPEQSVDKIQISPEAKRRQVVEQVATEILGHLADSGSNAGDVEQEIMDTLSREFGQQLSLGFDETGGSFRFDIVDAEAGEISGSVDGEQAEELSRRLIEITRDTVDRTMI